MKTLLILIGLLLLLQPEQTQANELHDGLSSLLAFLQENYNLVTLSIETKYRGVYEAAAKRIEYINFVKKEFLGYFSRIVQSVEGEDDFRQFIKLTSQYDYLFQIHDSIDDLFTAKKVMNDNYIELKSDILRLVRELSG